MTLCILQGADNFSTSSFIRAHIDLLPGNKVVLKDYYPNLTFNGRQIRYFESRHPLRRKMLKLMPHWLYHKLVTQWEESYAGRHDAISGLFERHDVDVVLAEFGIHGCRIAPHASDLGIPLLVHFHGHDAHRTPLIDTMRDEYSFMFEYAEAIFSVSAPMTDALIRMGAPASKIISNPYGPRNEFFDIAPGFEPTVLAIGRFTDIKAPHLTVLAFAEVAAEFPEAKLVMGGDGELLEACKQLVAALGLSRSVSFPGALHHHEVQELMAIACCFIQHSVSPTYGDSEGTPVAILEAGAAGLPLVATRHAGIPAAVIDGQTGFLVDELDYSAMADRLRALLANPDRARKMGEAGREHIRQNFNIQRHIDTIDQALTSARQKSS